VRGGHAFLVTTWCSFLVRHSTVQFNNVSEQPHASRVMSSASERSGAAFLRRQSDLHIVWPSHLEGRERGLSREHQANDIVLDAGWSFESRAWTPNADFSNRRCTPRACIKPWTRGSGSMAAYETRKKQDLAASAKSCVGACRSPSRPSAIGAR
jgi:hypothetical protein